MTSPSGALRSDQGVRRWIPYVAAALAFLFTLGVAGALAGDYAARNVEMRTLLTRIEASEAAMTSFQTEFEQITSQYAGSEALSVDQTDELNAQLTDLAARSRDAIAEAGAGVEAMRWLAWHQEIGRAQAAYVAHNHAWQAYLDRASKDPAEFGKPQDEVNTTFENAQAPIEGAVPAGDPFSLMDRVDAIFAPPADSSGGGQQA